MEQAIGETERRRAIQIAYNEKHGITPQTIRKKVHDVIEATKVAEQKSDYLTGVGVDKMSKKERQSLIERLEAEMKEAAKSLQFERAAELRDALLEIKAELKACRPGGEVRTVASDSIVIKGARAHNLKNIDVTIPRDKFVVLDRAERFRQIFAGLRYDLCGRTTPICRIACRPMRASFSDRWRSRMSIPSKGCRRRFPSTRRRRAATRVPPSVR